MDDFLRFIFGTKGSNEKTMWILRGYAGTGKTSLVASIIKALKEFKIESVLLAPTGRAAKVFSAYAGDSAFTVHKKIYRQKSTADGEGKFSIGYNKSHNTLFFVDEASMISHIGEESNFGSGHLLDDLVEYIYNTSNNRLILIGDVAQLPPVGNRVDGVASISPALNAAFLRSHYDVEVIETDMNEVFRQEELSGILSNATIVREMIGSKKKQLQLLTEGMPDVARITGAELLEELDSCYGKYGMDETMVICYSNKRAAKYNEGIRRCILYREEEFSGGDRIMVVKNNYFWGKEQEDIDFIANGEIATVVKVRQTAELYGFHFLNADISISGYEQDLSVWLLTDILFSDAPALTYEQHRTLYHNIENDYRDIRSQRKRFEKIRENPYYNAMQIKFAYAVTCHKAQGGQWDAVFVDQGWIKDDMLDDTYWRWLYTAITRARKKVYFVNFKKEFFPL